MEWNCSNLSWSGQSGRLDFQKWVFTLSPDKFAIESLFFINGELITLHRNTIQWNERTLSVFTMYICHNLILNTQIPIKMILLRHRINTISRIILNLISFCVFISSWKHVRSNILLYYKCSKIYDFQCFILCDNRIILWFHK